MIITFKSISTAKFDFLHFVKIIFIELFYCVVIYFFYAFFSFLMFGESANSFMYSKTNDIIYLSLIILPPTIFNIYQFLKHIKQQFLSKAKNYLLTSIIIAIAFLFFLWQNVLYSSPRLPSKTATIKK